MSHEIQNRQSSTRTRDSPELTEHGLPIIQCEAYNRGAPLISKWSRSEPSPRRSVSRHDVSRVNYWFSQLSDRRLRRQLSASRSPGWPDSLAPRAVWLSRASRAIGEGFGVKPDGNRLSNSGGTMHYPVSDWNQTFGERPCITLGVPPSADVGQNRVGADRGSIGPCLPSTALPRAGGRRRIQYQSQTAGSDE